MGALHDGHLSLARRARQENRTAGATIFINPTQFGPNEDLESYPRNLEQDLDLLEGMGMDFAFVPQVEEVYTTESCTQVDVGALTKRLEGDSRPGHFQGVCTVVLKLFNILGPDRAYFGQKDGQQWRIIRRMAADLNTGVEVVVCPTVREPDGLALSSRNNYLNAEERKAATVLYNALCLAQQANSAGERSANTIRKRMHKLIATEPSARIDYVSIADSETLEELMIIDRPTLVSLAIHIGEARLIDNITLSNTNAS
jgi:pantoate--beta-alanine ligase